MRSCKKFFLISLFLFCFLTENFAGASLKPSAPILKSGQGSFAEIENSSVERSVLPKLIRRGIVVATLSFFAILPRPVFSAEAGSNQNLSAREEIALKSHYAKEFFWQYVSCSAGSFARISNFKGLPDFCIRSTNYILPGNYHYVESQDILYSSNFFDLIYIMSEQEAKQAKLDGELIVPPLGGPLVWNESEAVRKIVKSDFMNSEDYNTFIELILTHYEADRWEELNLFKPNYLGGNTRVVERKPGISYDSIGWKILRELYDQSTAPYRNWSALYFLEAYPELEPGNSLSRDEALSLVKKAYTMANPSEVRRFSLNSGNKRKIDQYFDLRLD